MKYRKKPSVVEAITFDELVEYGRSHGSNIVNGTPWSFEYNGQPITHENDDCYLIMTPEGIMKMQRGDLLLVGVKGEIYPCKSDIFYASYEPMADAFERGVRSVTRIRCMEHRFVPPYNAAEAAGGECAACAVASLLVELRQALDAMEGQVSAGSPPKEPLTPQEVYGDRPHWAIRDSEHDLNEGEQKADAEVSDGRPVEVETVPEEDE